MTRPRASLTRKAIGMRRFRENNPGYGQREAARKTARSEALEALARRYPAEFTALYGAELAHAGLDAVPLERPCGCGGIVRRPNRHARWPQACETCREAS